MYIKRHSDKTVRDSVYETLKTAIISGEIPPHTRIKEVDFAQKMHVSRTPLREALRKLKDDDLIEIIENKGVFVKAFTLDDVEEIFTIRELLEGLTAKAIVQKLTSQHVADIQHLLKQIDAIIDTPNYNDILKLFRAFHTYVLNISGMRRVISAINYQEEYIDKFLQCCISMEDRRKEAQKEHYRIFKAIISQDEDNLKQAMCEHIRHSKQVCINCLKEQPKKQ